MKTKGSRPYRLATLGCSLALAFSLSAPAFAQEVGVGPIPEVGPERFGDAGQLFISSSFQMDVTYSKTENEEARTRLVIAPSVGYFIIPNLALGGTVRLVHDGDVDTTAFEIAPYMGFNFWIADQASVMPTLSLEYAYRTLPSSGGADITRNEINTRLELPFLFHPVPHLFVGLSPFAQAGLFAQVEGKDANKTHQFGISFRIGGWL